MHNRCPATLPGTACEIQSVLGMGEVGLEVEAHGILRNLMNGSDHERRLVVDVLRRLKVLRDTWRSADDSCT